MKKMNPCFEDVRRMSLSRLERHGISGADVYLIDVIPLIEMIWADGMAQQAEVSILENYLDHHVKNINHIAGYRLLDLDRARAFVAGFLVTRPAPELMRTLRELIPGVRMCSTDEKANDLLEKSLLATCLDIAASCVSGYPYGIGERFDPREKRCYFEIVESLHHRS